VCQNQDSPADDSKSGRIGRVLSAHAIVGSIIIPTLIRPSSPVNGHIQGAHGGFDWLGTSTPWWVTPGVALLAVYLTARATTRQTTRTERRKAVVANRRTLLSGFDLEPTGSWKSYTPGDQDLELALIEMGFTRSQTWDLTRRLWDHRNAEEDLKRLQELSLLEMTVMAVHRSEFRNIQTVLSMYVSGEISLFRTRRKLFGLGYARRDRKATAWAEGQYNALHPDAPRSLGRRRLGTLGYTPGRRGANVLATLPPQTDANGQTNTGSETSGSS
jgi:hypothetical protein